MLELLVLPALAVAVAFLVLRLITRWAAFSITRQVESKLRAADHIVNEGHVPEQWIRLHRERLDPIRHEGEGADVMERLGHRAQEHCLRQLDGLIRFFRRESFFDSPETRDTMLHLLRETRDQWAAEGWQALVRLDADPQQPAREIKADVDCLHSEMASIPEMTRGRRRASGQSSCSKKQMGEG